MLNTHTDDDCCGALINQALAGELSEACLAWRCPQCGTLWRPKVERYYVGTGEAPVEFRHWTPDPEIAIWKR